MLRRCAVLCGIGLGLASATSSQAAVLLQFDLNSLNVQARNVAGAPVSFGGTTHTGSLVLSKGATGDITDVRIDGAEQNGSGGTDTFNAGLDSLTATINLVNGEVEGGSLSFQVSGPNGIDTYSLDILNNDSKVQAVAGGNFVLGTIAVNGNLNDGTFGGVNVQPWSLNEPLTGELLLLPFQPSANGAGNVNIEISAVVPEPGTMAAASIVVGGLLLRRRRGQ